MTKRGKPSRSQRSGRQPAGRRQRQGSGERRGRRGGARGLGGDQVEGRHAVRELLLAGLRPVREVLIGDDLDRADIIDDITDLAGELGVPLRAIGRKRLAAEAATGSHQGVIARAAPVPEHPLDELVAGPEPFLLVLDGVTDPGNLGAVLRTAECAGVTGVVLPRHRSVHLTPTVTKAAAGAIEHLPMAVVGGIPAALTRLAESGVTTVGLDAGGDRPLFGSLPAVDGVALVLGAEGRGLSRLVRERVDMLVAIPLRGGLNSLNIAAAAAIACFEVVRTRPNQTN
ncbi:MAG: 23S rRNA (guanosine(2251)-2'-O)-methyltransferase RlmB [Acidimicrobiia bacterium]|nr:23S rRNA (guanosine(2251)-2'-O)-methyltransferase RlmB [Acidimicrobiia bacterium]